MLLRRGVFKLRRSAADLNLKQPSHLECHGMGIASSQSRIACARRLWLAAGFLGLLVAAAPSRAQVLYDYASRTQGTDIFAYDGADATALPSDALTPANVLSAGEYDDIEVEDASFHAVTGGFLEYSQMRFAIQIDESESSVVQLDLSWTGNGVSTSWILQDGAAFYIWNYASSSYELLSDSGNTPSTVTLTGSVTSSPADYIGGASANTITLFAVTRSPTGFFSTTTLSTDYLKVEVFTSTPPAGRRIVLSTTAQATLGGLTFEREDVADYDFDADSATLLFDGSAVFATARNLDAVHLLGNGHIILSTNRNARIGGLNFEAGDLVEYDPVAGTAALYLDGSAVFAGAEDIDAACVRSDGHIVLSTAGAARIGSLNFGQEDLVDYDPVAGTATLCLDGSAAFGGAAQINAVHVLDSGNIALSTAATETIGGVQFRRDELVEYDPTTGTASILFTGSAYFSDTNEDIDAVYLEGFVSGSGPGSYELYWTDDGTNRIQGAQLDGSGVGTLLTGLSTPDGIALDASAGKLYWSDDGTNKIQCMDLSDGSVADLVTGLNRPRHLAIDVSGGKLYWADDGTNRIQRANLDGSSVENLVTGLNRPDGVAVDGSAGKIYWTDDGTNRIQRANLDGTSVEDVVTGLDVPRGIAVDPTGGKIYWTDDGTNRLQRANLDGTSVENLVTGLNRPDGVALDLASGKVYWIDDGPNEIQRANLDGTSTEVVLGGLRRPRCLALEAGTPAIGVDHFVLSHDGAGINCLAEAITITAVDAGGSTLTGYTGSITLDTQTGTGTWADGGNGGIFSDAIADDGIASYTFAAVDAGTASFWLSYESGAASFDIDGYETATPTIRDDDSEGSISFAPSGFTVTASLLPNPPPNPIDDPVGSQTAGSPFALHLAAFGQTATDPTCGVIEAYTGAHTLKFWLTYADPSSGSLTASVDGAAIATAEGTASGQSVTFSAGQAAVVAKYKDVGRIQISMKDDTVTEPVSGIRGASNLLVVKPADFVVTSVTRTDLTANPGSSTTAGDVFVAAGAPFRVLVEVRDAEGSLTPNYGNEVAPEGIVLGTATLVAPLGGQPGSVGNASAFGAVAPAGSFEATTISWSEVGATTLRASVADGDYLGAGDVLGTESETVGRFTPSRFAVAYNTPQFDPGCSTGLYTYAGEPFGFTSGQEPVLTVTAESASGATTQNYTGSWWRMDNTSLTGRSYSSAVGTLDPGGLPATGSDPAIADLGNGTGTLTFSSGTGLFFTRTSPVAPFDADISLAINVVDLDGIAFAGNPARFGAATAGNGIAFAGGAKEIRYGRLVLANAHGSELVTLPVPLEAEYYHSSGYFVRNTEDTLCSSVGVLNLVLTKSPAGLPTTASIGNDPLLLGVADLRFSPPGDANVGTIDIRVDLSVATGAGRPWLQYDWPSDGNTDGVPDDDPSSRATFGIYRGSDRVIYQRELY